MSDTRYFRGDGVDEFHSNYMQSICDECKQPMTLNDGTTALRDSDQMWCHAKCLGKPPIDMTDFFSGKFALGQVKSPQNVPTYPSITEQFAEAEDAQVDWGKLADAIASTVDSYDGPENWDVLLGRELRTTFEPLVTAAWGVRFPRPISPEEYPKAQQEAWEALGAALDWLPKVGG